MHDNAHMHTYRQYKSFFMTIVVYVQITTTFKQENCVSTRGISYCSINTQVVSTAATIYLLFSPCVNTQLIISVSSGVWRCRLRGVVSQLDVSWWGTVGDCPCRLLTPHIQPGPKTGTTCKACFGFVFFLNLWLYLSVSFLKILTVSSTESGMIPVTFILGILLICL